MTQDHIVKHRFHGRRKGKPLTAYRQGLVDETYLNYAINPDDVSIIGQKPQTWLEIGFGNGEFLSHMCQTHDDIQFIGCEPFTNGVAALLASLEKPVSNLSLWMDDARILIDAIPDQSLDRIYLLNPDPWPKTRHHKRRYVQPHTLDHLARILKPGGQFTMSSDHHELAQWMFEHTNDHPAFAWADKTGADWLTPPSDWPIGGTRYMKKAMAGKDIYWLIFKRN